MGLYFPLKSPMLVTGVLEKAESQQSREVGLTFFGLARAQCREFGRVWGLELTAVCIWHPPPLAKRHIPFPFFPFLWARVETLVFTGVDKVKPERPW